MPKQNIDYSKTIIYKIVCNDLNIKECYVGHTTDFRKRKNQHKCRCNLGIQFNVYQFININGGWENWNMLEIEKFPCMSNNEARTRERYWVECLEAKLNQCTPIVSKEESIKRKSQNFYRLHKDKIKEKKKEKVLCECGCIIRYGFLSRHKKTKKHEECLKK